MKFALLAHVESILHCTISELHVCCMPLPTALPAEMTWASGLGLLLPSTRSLLLPFSCVNGLKGSVGTNARLSFMCVCIGENLRKHLLKTKHAANNEFSHDFFGHCLCGGFDVTEIIHVLLHELHCDNCGRLKDLQGIRHHELSIVLQVGHDRLQMLRSYICSMFVFAFWTSISLGKGVLTASWTSLPRRIVSNVCNA